MDNSIKNKNPINIIALILKIILLVLTTLIFFFALASGSSGQGDGIKGILKNLPNALPWVLLYIFVFITWKWELIGGIILVVFSGFSFIFFNVLKGNPFVLFFIVVPLFSIGVFFVIYYFKLKKNNKLNKEIKK